VLPPGFGETPRSASATLSHVTVSTGAAYFRIPAGSGRSSKTGSAYLQ